MLTISRQTDYACRILLHLALQPAGARVTAAEIAEQRLIPPAMIRRIVTDLGVAGLIKTTRGNNGGITLGRPAGEISLLDVVQAVEGAVALNPCTIAPRNDPDTCPFIPTCPVHDAWMQARATLVRELSQVTFDRLAEQGLASNPLQVKEE
jgi:Rrf2 family protein